MEINQVQPSGQRNMNVCHAPYHAAGDGITNDRAAIQRAIDTAAATGGGTVLLPEGGTFLSGELELKSNVTLQIDGVLRKSNDPAHYAHPTVFGRMTPGSPLNWDLCSYVNYPLIFTTSGTTNVTIQGSGALDMNYTGEDETTVQAAAIGFYDTEHFLIRDITIRDACQPQIWPIGCRYGEVANVKIIDPAIRWNNEAICLCNCQHMHIHHNYSICGDDNIDVWSSYQDRRMRVWCSSDQPQPSINIEIDHNTLGQIGCGANFNIVPWGSLAPDQELVRIDNLNIHDNILLPFVRDERENAMNSDYHPKFHYQEWNERSTYGHAPLSNIRINDNGIGSDTMHDGPEEKFPCAGFQTNDITDPWFTNAISEMKRT
ncbi:MAG: hypothetical protein EHM21_08370 [Chloroflexi bacterium]|nr:MAG: hypothetical protein EHM21_08370 [Chloroflexota bacterium]